MNPYPCSGRIKANPTQYCNGCSAFDEYINKLADDARDCECKKFNPILIPDNNDYIQSDLVSCIKCGRVYSK